MSSEILFVGYLTLEEWLRSVDKQRPVFLLLSSTDEAAAYVQTRKMVIDVAQPEHGQAMVHYCRLPAGTMRFMGDDPVESDHPRRLKRANGLLRIVETWLEEQGLAILHGTIATPHGLRMVESWAGFIEFDKATLLFTRKEG